MLSLHVVLGGDIECDVRLAETDHRQHLIDHFGEDQAQEIYERAKAAGEIHAQTGQERSSNSARTVISDGI